MRVDYITPSTIKPNIVVFKISNNIQMTLPKGCFFRAIMAISCHTSPNIHNCTQTLPSSPYSFYVASPPDE